MKTICTFLFAAFIFASCNKTADVPASTDFYNDGNVTITSAKAENTSTGTKFTIKIQGAAKISSLKAYAFPTSQVINFPAITDGENTLTVPTPGAQSFQLWIYEGSDLKYTDHFSAN